LGLKSLAEVFQFEGSVTPGIEKDCFVFFASEIRALLEGAHDAVVEGGAAYLYLD
jgi:hypothetical protein